MISSESSNTLKILKLWARSGSLSFAKGLVQKEASNQLSSFKLRGNREVYFRPGTGDVDLIHRILVKPSNKREYQFPKEMSPKVILDIGANIGATTILLRETYPNAEIYSFEPEPSNFKVLKENTKHDPKIHAYNIALGCKNEEAELFLETDANNLGGFSLKRFHEDFQKSLKVQVRNIDEFLREIGLQSVDLIKIDTEGAENEILGALSSELLQTVQWICGELHGVDDFELLRRLNERFNLGVRKSVHSRLAYFEASRKNGNLSL